MVDHCSDRERGAALIIVLWMLLLMSLLAASFVVTRHADLEVARNVIDSAHARALADAGITRATVALGESDPRFRWRVDGSANRWIFGHGTIIVSIISETGKIDINVASAEVLASLFRFAGADDNLSLQLTQEILDRRNASIAAPFDPDRDALGAGAKQPVFVTIEEIGGLAGMTATVLQGVLPLVTVYSGAATIDPYVAPLAVLLSLPGANKAEIDTFVASRAGHGPSDPMPDPPPSIARYLATAAVSAVTVRASATTDTGAVFVREALVVLRAGYSPFVVERWAQGVAAQ